MLPGAVVTDTPYRAFRFPCRSAPELLQAGGGLQRGEILLVIEPLFTQVYSKRLDVWIFYRLRDRAAPVVVLLEFRTSTPDT